MISLQWCTVHVFHDFYSTHRIFWKMKKKDIYFQANIICIWAKMITISCSAVTNYFISLENKNKLFNLPLCAACQVNAGQSLRGPNSCPNQNLGVIPWVSSIQGGRPWTPYGHGFILPFEPHQEMNQSGWVNEALLYLWGVLSQSTGLVIQVF